MKAAPVQEKASDSGATTITTTAVKNTTALARRQPQGLEPLTRALSVDSSASERVGPRKRLDPSALFSLRPIRTAAAPQRITSHQQAQQKEFSILGSEGWFSRRTGQVHADGNRPRSFPRPAGIGRFINVATLKEVVGHPDELVLEQVADRWRPLPDDHQIDLTDETLIFRIGPLAIYS